MKHLGSLSLSWQFEIPDGTELTQEIKDQLNSAAQERGLAMEREGYCEGEVVETIDDVEYHGWWTAGRS